MNIMTFILELQKKQVFLAVNSGKLSVDAPKGALDSQTFEKLKLHKNEIIEHLSKLTNVEEEIKTAEYANSYPLSFAQQRLWFIDQIEQSSASYNIPWAFEVNGEFDISTASKALTAIIEKHEVLRTVYINDAGQGRQQVLPDFEFAISEYDFTQDADGIQLFIEEEASRPFDLASELVLRVSYLKKAQDIGVIVFNIHHIAFDEWSLEILMAEFMQNYSQLYAGQDIVQETLDVQYRDFAVWQNKQVDKGIFKAQLDYWHKQLADAPVTHELALQRNRPEVNQKMGNKHRFSLPAQTKHALDDLAKSQSVTPFVLVHAIFALMLTKATRNSDVVIGTPSAGRSNSQLEGMIGFFVNFLSLRTDSDGYTSFSDFLEYVKEVNLGALQHQDVPFDRVLEHCGIERNPQMAPLFQIVLSVHQSSQAQPRDMLWGLTPVNIEHTSANFDLMLEVGMDTNALEMMFTYDSALFSEQYIASLAQYFCTVCQQVVANKDVNIADIQLVDQQKQQILIDEVKSAYSPVSVNQYLHQQFEEISASHPTRIAVCDEAHSLSYQELNEQANRLARYLTAHGTKVSDKVGICLSRSTEFVVAMLATLKVGGTYVPMDPDYPEARLTHIIQDSDIKVVITSASLQSLPVLGSDRIECIALDDTKCIDALSSLSCANVTTELPESLLAYIIYTSGSSGLPKGVQVTHKNVLRLFKSSEQQFQFSEQDVWSCFHSTAFDFSVWELWGALLYGAKTVMVSYEDSRSPQRFAELLAAHGVTVLSQTASAFYQLSEYVLEHNSPHQLRYVVFGGEYLNFTKLSPWMDRYGSETTQLINMYGITETTVHVTYQKIERAHCEQGISLIGKPLQDLTCYVVDEHGNCQPPGVPGELWVGGQGVTNGYLNRPELNTEKFIADPFSAESNAVIYRSGDLVRWLDDMSLQYLGRIDEQVKIRGFRIELGEIEASLNQHPYIKSCAVLTKPTEQSGHELAVYFTLVDDAEADDFQALLRTLHSYLQVKLPKHMVPTAYAMLEELPMTVNGKLNRSALLSLSVNYVSEEYHAPETLVQRQLCTVFEQTLGCEKVGIQDNFFNLGGDSIRAISLVANAAKIGLQISVKDLFSYQSVASLAAAIEQGNTESTTEVKGEPFALLTEEQRQALPQMTSAPIEDAFPLTATQQGMLIHNMLDVGGGTYHDVPSVRLKIQWHPELFAQALSAVVERHSVLRSTFEYCCAQPIQVIYERITLPLKVRAITDDELNDLALYEQQCLASELASPFEMGELPWRMAVHTITDDDIYLHISFHHSLLDGWSFASFNTELINQYKRLLAGQELLIQPKPPAYSLNVAQEMAAVESGKSRQYFKTQLENANLPWWSNFEKGNPLEVVSELSAEQRERLNAIAKQLKVSEKSILLSAHTALMAFLGGQEDVVTSVISNSRPELSGSEQTLGLFLNSLPMRIDVSKGSWQQLIKRVHSESVELMSHRSYPLIEIQRASKLEFGSAAFSFIDFHVYKNISDEVAVESGSFFEKTDIMLSVKFINNQSNNALGFRIHTNVKQFDLQYVQRIRDYLQKIITQIVEDHTQEIDFDSLLEPTEVEALVAFEQHGVQAKKLGATSVVELFAQQVEQNSNAIAVSMSGQSLTYSKLNKRVNNLACALREEDVGESDKVGIYLDRSIESLVSVLAVMKSGASYVPLDVQDPALRNQVIIEQMQAGVIISHESQVLPFNVAGVSELVLEGDITQDDWLEDFADDEPFSLPGLQQIAYVLFTSGSTGIPQGVEVSHASLSAYLAHAKSHYFNNATQSLVSSTLSVDATITSLLGPLTVGGTVNFLADDDNDTASIAGFLKFCQLPCVFKMTPSQMTLVAERLSEFSSPVAHTLVIGGEELYWKTINKWRSKHLSNATFINEYGPTESTVGCCFEVISPETPSNSDQMSVAIGSPVAGTSLFVLNGSLQRVPLGSVGELFIAGAGLSTGYSNLPDLTKKMFTEKTVNGQKIVLYRTGDMVRYLANGKLEFIERKSEQVKIRGHKVELNEIKHQILAVKGVNSAFVATAESSLSTDRDFISSVKLELGDTLPDYMIPSVLMKVDEWPLTPNGKVDRKALLALEKVDSETHVPQVSSTKEVQDSQLKYWLAQLDDAPAVHGLPLSYPRPEVKQEQGAVVSGNLPSSVAQQLKQLAQKFQLTPFMLIHGAVSLLLSKHCNSSDIVIGTPVVQQTQSDLESAQQCTMNALVLRVDTKHKTLAEYLAHIQSVNLAAQSNQNVSFERLLEVLKVPIDTAHSPLFQIMLSTHTEHSQLADCAREMVKADHDLNIDVSINDEGVGLSWTYDVSLFNEAAITRLNEHFCRLLTALSAVTDGEVEPHSLPMLSQSECYQLVTQLNDTGSNYSEEKCVHELFESQVAANPNKIAVAFEETHLTYAELNVRANQVAHCLVTQYGVKPDTLVGLCVERSLEMVIGILGVLKAGGAYVPLDPSYPQARLNHMLDDAGLTVVLCEGQTTEVLDSTFTGTVIDLGDHQLFAEYDTTNLSTLALEPTHLAYVIYTSGSTGKPKGVMVEHRNLVDYMSVNKRNYYDGNVAGSLIFTSLSFDLSLPSLYLPLLNGDEVKLVGKEDILAPCVKESLSSDSVRLVRMTPSHLMLLLDQFNGEQVDTEHVFIVGGEAFEHGLASKCLETFPSCRLVNHYGPSESTIGCTSFSITRGVLNAYNTIPIGKAMDNASMLLLSDTQQLLPFGVTGELYIGGAGLARGYLNHPELTAQRFIDNPYYDASVPGSSKRLYRTGDLVRYLPDGNLEFMGRVDDQVKIRGFRIELGEVESQLAQLSNVNSALVLAKEVAGRRQLFGYVKPTETARSEQTVLVAYYAANDGMSLDNQIRQNLEKHLPDYMLPKIVVAVDEFKLTKSGKVDVASLPDISSIQSSLKITEPTTSLETQMRNVWAMVLRVAPDSLDVQADFFELGGDSILAIQVAAKARHQGIFFTVADLFEYSTIRSLSREATTNKGFEVPQEAVEGQMPLLPIQRAFLNSGIELDYYNQAVLLNTPPEFNSSALTAIVEALIERHDALRLSFKLDGNIWQANHEVSTAQSLSEFYAVEKLDLSDKKQLTAVLNNYQQSFELSGPLAKFVYIEDVNNEREGRLFVVIHHLVVDGVSWRILLSDIEAVFAQFHAFDSVQLAPKSSSYKAWGAFLKKHAADESMAAQLPYWKGVISKQTCPLPINEVCDIKEREVQKSLARISLTQKETRQLTTQAILKYDLQVNELLLSSLLIALHQWSGGNQFLIDMEGHGRETLNSSLDLTETVGWFTSIYPVALGASEESLRECTYEQIINHVKNTYRDIPENGIGFGVIAGSDLAKELGDYEPAKIQFNYLGQFDNVTVDGEFFSIAAESTGDSASRNRPLAYKLGLVAMVTNGCMQFNINFDLSDFSQQQADLLANYLQQALQGLISHCIASLGEQSISEQFPEALAPAEKLTQWQSQFDVQDIYPATGMQQGLLFHSELDSGAYITQIRLDFEHVIPETLKSAWHNIANRHDIFKTAFVGFEEGHCHQLVQHEVELNWSEVSLVHLDAAAQQEEVERIRCQDANTKFNIIDAPLMRFHLLNLGENGYVLIWSHHHSLMDGWSMSMVFQEVARVYQAELTNKPVTLPAVVPYKNYIQWLNKQDQAASLTFWQAQLSDDLEPTPLPLMDLTKVAESKEEFALQLTSEQTQSLVEFARKIKTTVNILLQSSWAILLSRYSSENTVTFGYTTAGRPPALENIDKMVGLFINTLPCRAEVDDTVKVSDFLIAQRDALSQRELHNFISATEIQSAIHSHAVSELYNSVIVFENYPIKDVSAHVNNAGLVITDVQPYARTNFPLSLIAHLGDTLSIRFEYHLGQYSTADIETVGQQLKAVLLQLVEKAQARVCDIDLAVDAAEEALQESESGIESIPFFTLNDKVAEYAQQLPMSPAVSSEDGELNYQDLAKKVAHLAVALQDEGLVSGQAVGICMERSVKSTVAMLAVLKAGGFYVPIDAKTPSARINHIIDDCGMELMLVDEHTIESVPLDGVDFMMLDDELFDEDWYQCSEQELQDAKVSIQSSDTAYVIYTSGSTGKPKGVAVSHANLAHYLNYAASQYFDGVKGAVVSTSLSFDATITSVFTPLVCGKEVVLIEQGSRELDSLAAFIANAASPMLFKLTPSHLNALAKLYGQSQTKVEHMCIVGGENLSWGTVEQWRNSVMPNACIINEYGPTEATVGCVVFKILAHENAGQTAGSVPIGTPIHNTVLRVLDKDGRAVPKGAKGELYIGGAGVTKGYMNRSALTQEKFIEFSDDTSKALTYYRTGDIVRYRHDGDLEFISRVDEQVKVRGYRIETGEIEHHLLSHQSISAAHVMLDDTAAQHLVAYIACDIDMDLAELERSLRASLALELNDYMCPSQYVFLAQLPLTANGKVDRKALPKWQAHSTQASSSGPVGEIENQLANIWAQLLEVELAAITQDSDFFLLGGHSLLAIQLITAIRETFNVEISLHQIFDASSLSGQGAVIEQADAATFTPAIQPASLDMTHYPLTHAQERLWFIDQMGQGSSQYNMPLAFEVSGQFDVDLIEQTLGEIVARHQVLRSNFVTVDEQPQITYEHAQPFKLHRVDLSHLDAQARQHEVAQIQFENATKVFDLAKDLLVRASYVKLTNGLDVESGALLLCFHHIVFDGWSIGILMKEFNAIYAAKKRNCEAELNLLPVQYQDYAVWQRTWEGEQQYLADQTYWTEALAGSPQIHSIPTDKVRPARQSFAGSAVPFKLDQAQTNKLKAFCQSRGVTLSMALQTVFSVLLNRYSGESDILFGTPVANRDRKEVEPLIGFFVNLVVMRVGVESQSSFDSLLQTVKQTSLAAQSHQSYPFDKLVSELDITRSVSHAPLVQVIFSMNTNKVDALETTDFEISPMHAEQLVAKLDLSLDVEEYEDEIGFSLGYCTDLFEAETIQQMSDNYLLIIENMLSSPELEVAQALVNQRASVTEGSVKVTETSAPFIAVHESVKRFAAEMPDALALTDGVEQLSYAQLVTAAHTLSIALHEKGVGQNSLVGVVAENSVKNVVLMVALSQMGAVYVPFDQRLPAQRVEKMIESSGAEYLVCPSTAHPFEHLSAAQFNLDELFEYAKNVEVENVGPDNQVSVQKQQLAYVIHTSGSTGMPKGVMIEHLALASFVQNHNSLVGTPPQSKVMSILSPAFDAGLGVIWSSLYSGATLCLGSFEKSLSTQLVDFEVQQISLTPSILESLSWQSEFKLETLILGGEACPESTVEKWQKHCRLINEYGPTETTVTAMSSDWSVSHSRSLGHVYPGFQAAVIDENGNPCPVGAIGELYLAGDQLARGYINAPELTAKVFVEMTLPGCTMQRFYKTGDLVRILPSGEFSFVGRADTQVKIRGFRIELEEIENKIMLMDGVEQAVVDVRVLNGVENIVAYFVAIKDIEKPQFKEHLASLLPDYMVPNHYVSLEAMPLTVNGKVDRKSLPVPQLLHREQTYVAPTNELEHQICNIWQELLQIERVGLEDNFFDLGGHSLLAARMYTSIQHQFDIELSLQEILEQPVVSELVKVIDTAVRLKEGLISQRADDSSDAEEDVWEL
ncbi:non-ribosomal peptide synthetase [Pseudoalteromonas luteoviolacea]|uniref:Non-ribosomal peptide synthase n=1 Tax=Pseudoalteromonas luteoviolacea (strain 2ta16) TaxID=1353533 RepID=V4I129_PSEL2|nr:non-ribosomal peptide synthetase [Pseudoalteromonas luteoviolacea]ESP93929.1 non-ribosomal peptide synthase [Pseudoalteromonas luteoviolacea 2ta16]KZN31361.1 hypothetical protein N483_05935 [Pseudoalteromonas luteoviolacea NCIMB 1944]